MAISVQLNKQWSIIKKDNKSNEFKNNNPSDANHTHFLINLEALVDAKMKEAFKLITCFTSNACIVN